MHAHQLTANRQLVNKFFGLLALAAFVWGVTVFNAPPQVPQTGVPDLAALRAAGNAPVVVDVRGPEAWNRGHIDGARHIPLDDLDARIKELPADKAQRVVVYCGDGSKLGPLGTAKLQSMGFSNVANLSGGIEGWRAAGQKIATGKG